MGPNKTVTANFSPTPVPTPTSDASFYFSKGNDYFDSGIFQLAVQEYSQVIWLDPDFASAYYNRGLAYANLDQDHLAVQDYTKFIQLDSDDADG